MKSKRSMARYQSEAPREDSAVQQSPTYLDAHIYQGQLVNGQRHGIGRTLWQDGRAYEGEWHNDTMHGVGTITVRTGATYMTLFMRNMDMKRRLRRELVAHQVDQAAEILNMMAANKLSMKDQLIFNNLSVVHICARMNQWPLCANALSFCNESERRYLIDMPESKKRQDSPLRLACRLGQKEFLAELLRAGCDVTGWEEDFGVAILEDARRMSPGDVANIEACILLVEKQLLWVRQRALIYVLRADPWASLDAGIKRHLVAFV
eukprot:GEMP01052863.1.p1 GENE.GEMP01052863.1~~GEMP01052863.1.p1  ORF type:complete len:264 (+),score=77.43 GEMP01052863.1:76-867(+)